MAMSALEDEIIEKFRQLDGEARKRVLLSLAQEQEAPMTLAAALQAASAFRERLRQKYGKGHVFGVQSMLDEIREEASWPRR
jgi:hypothetical protein